MSPKELLQELEELGVSVKSHMSFVDEEIANIIIDLLEEDRGKKSKQPSKSKRESDEEIEKEVVEKKKRRKITLKPDELKLDIIAEK